MNPEQRAELRRLCGLAELDNDGDVWFKGCNSKAFAFGVARLLPALLDYVETLEEKDREWQRYARRLEREIEKKDRDELESIRAQNYRITVTIEATAPAAAHGYCGKGGTVAEAVRSLGEMMNKAKEKA